MAQFLITYLGGDPPASPEEGRRNFEKYKEWLSSLGESAVSPANLLKDTNIVNPDGTVTAGSKTTMSGYTIIEVDSMAAALEARDPYTAGHQRRVAELAVAIAREMAISPNQIEGIKIAATIHDIGKIYVPAEILSKPGNLSALEFSLIKVHPQVGHDILRDIDFPWPVAEMVLQHHEHLDGSGYPNGISGDQILLESRILTVADVVESLVTHRPYRPALGIEAALDEIDKRRGKCYDPRVVDACLALFQKRGYRLEVA